MRVTADKAFSVIGRRDRSVILALSWTLGLLAGGFCYLMADSGLLSLTRHAFLSEASLADFMLVSGFPILIIALGLLMDPRLLIPFCFFRGFTVLFISAAICTSVDDGGWFLRLLVMLGRILLEPFVYCGFVNVLRNNRFTTVFLLLLATVMCYFLCNAEYMVITPMLVSMIDIS